MTRTFIYGSCVSRDTFEFLIPQGYELLNYVARQSLLSASAPPTSATIPHVDITSAFQRRMLVGDWESNMLPTLAKYAEWTDLLLWDLCDERLGVRRWSGGTVTRSVDAISSGLDTHLDQTSEVLALGTFEHLTSFTEGLQRFRETLQHVGLLDRTLLVAPPWAIRTEDGTRSPASFGMHAETANRLFTRYEEAVHDVLGIPVVTLPTEATKADVQHRWGLSPFHYSEDVYQTLAKGIERHRPTSRTIAVDRRPGVFYCGPIGYLSPLRGMEEEFQRTGHVTQQSLISASSPATQMLKNPQGLSASAATTVMRDLQSSLYGQIRSAAAKTDLLVLDLAVERYGVLKLPDGSYVTRSSEFVRSGLVTSLPSPPSWLRPGTQPHASLWTKAAEQLVSVLEEVGLKERTLILVSHQGTVDPSIWTMANALAGLGVPMAAGHGRPIIRAALVTAQQHKIDVSGDEHAEFRR